MQPCSLRVSLVLVLAAVAWPARASAAPCEDFDCGRNTPHIETVYFWELELDTAKQDADEAEVELLRWAPTEALLAAGDSQLLDVEDGKFSSPAVPPWGSVKGSVMEVRVGAKNYWIKIADMRTAGATFWAEPLGPVTTYHLMYRDPSAFDGYQDLCKASSEGPDPGWTHATHAIVFDGDRYNPYSRTVESWPTTAFTAWFNIACAGSLVSKMYLLRRTRSSAPPGLFVPWTERQAFVNLLSGSYCGDGHPFTVAGEPIRMRAPWIPETGPVGFADFEELASKEAVWSHEGAVCLDVARREDNRPGTTTSIRTHCEAVNHPLPTCTPDLFEDWSSGDWSDHGVVMSGNPYPSPAR